MPYYEGRKFEVIAHYGLITKMKTETYDNRSDAIIAKDRHVAAGANVEIYELYWREQRVASGWYPASKD